ncbi:glucokinase [Bacillus wiedmannii]|uniref:ROK family protein n=1 Tax=Bacillus TaxID=1386 RepID=UPI00077A14F2|nr:ROK family protein [Bacillus wiedmannii]MDA1598864.1 ROK family protein [Bacillus cereus]HDR8172832.1 ROK family protein [Bacillus thuringiensis]KXY03018.1 glucokinase [Bacillus wiedmannii]MCT6916129.1 ROK family protein [Bacillus wiedmannii]MED2840263.1 ROK family protein [Bacillus wiedmannii]
MGKYVACFDIGGTFIKYAMIDEQGIVHEQGKITTPVQNQKKEILYRICEVLYEFEKSYKIHSVGVSSCGIIDNIKGEVLYSANISGYSGTKIADYIYSETGYVAIVENDVRSACLGEMWKGAGRGKEHIVLITLGTGIGSGIITNGKMLQGVKGLAGELGHMIIVHNGEKCSCGGEGCYERYASTSALIRQYKEASKIQGLEIGTITGEEIIERMYRGERLAKNVYEQFLQYVVAGLVNITYIFNPELIIIGGGITEQGEPFLKQIQERFYDKIMDIYQNKVKIVLASLHNDAGVYGACYVALNRCEEKSMNI